MKKLSALFAGTLFGLGLTISQMTNPEVVIAFLDITGNWDWRLIIVMASGLVVTTVGYLVIFRTQKTPVFSNSYHLPGTTNIDFRLLLGAALFGLGWGLAGYCPGPAIAGLTINPTESITFLVSMVTGTAMMRLLTKQRS
ncbi:DUF6691 family protein [Thalassotalea euphylliae]|uniref:DUF6691 family protein n=1 Tax=Thalassotalea euphylliae TaxID=1655234 RepID=UPI003630B82A